MVEITRIKDSQAHEVDEKDFHLIVTVEPGGERWTGSQKRKVKPDRRMAPLVAADRKAPDLERNVLLIETDNPDDPEVVQGLKDRLNVTQPRMRQS